MSGWPARIPRAHAGCAGSGGEMSLLNRMLQDLDARQGSGVPVARLPDDVRPLPVVPESRLPRVFAGLLFAASAAGVAAFFLWPEVGEISPTTPPAVSAHVNVPPVLTPPVPEKQPDPIAAESPQLGQLEGSLRLADALFMPVDKKPTPKSTAPKTPTPVEPVRPKNPAIDKPRVPESLPVVEPAPPGKPSLIEKTDARTSPRERADADYRKAIASVNQGRITEALEGLRTALRQDGQHVAARQLLVKLLLEARRSDEAMQTLQEGLQGLPAQSGWAMALARLQAERGDFASAWQTLNRSMPAGGASADYQGFAGHVLHRLGRSKDATEHYQLATRLAPGDGRWWLGLGLAHDAEGRVTEARDALQRAKASGTLSPELLVVVEQKLR